MAFISINLFFCISCTTESSTETYIRIVDISPEPETHLTLADTITATLDYSISDEHESDFGYGIIILFVAKPEYGGYVPHSWSGFQFQSRRGKMTIDFPLSKISDHAHKIIDPIVLYFKLEKWISNQASEIIASTDEVAYK
jgi:hypothetical protein